MISTEARALREEIAHWCRDHMRDPDYQIHRGYTPRGFVMDTWVRSFGGLLLIPRPTDGAAYFLDVEANRSLVRLEMETGPLEFFHRQSALLWENLIGGDAPSRNLERNFFRVVKANETGGLLDFWTPALVSHFPDFGAFGYEAVLDNLFTGFTKHQINEQPLRTSSHRIEIRAGETHAFQIKAKGGRKPYSYATTGGAISVTQTGRVTLDIPTEAVPGEFMLHVVVTDYAGNREAAAVHVTILPTEEES